MSAPSSNVIWVSQARPSRTPTTISGTISRDSWADVLEKAKEPKATGPVPGSSTESVMSAFEDQVAPPDVCLEEALRAGGA